MPSDYRWAMREASSSRTVTDTASYAFLVINQSNANEGMTAARNDMKQFIVRMELLAVSMLTFFSASAFEVDGISYIESYGYSGCVTVGGNYEHKYEGKVYIPKEVDWEGKTYTVVGIESEAFSDCPNLISVSVDMDARALTTVGSYAFIGCDNLVSVSLPWVTTLGSNAFDGCSSLVTVSIPLVKIIESCTFRDCTSLESVDISSVEVIDGVAFENCKSLLSISFPSLRTMGNSSFYGCGSLASVNLPRSVTSIDGCPFIGCSNLQEINVDPYNGSFSSIDGVLYDKRVTCLIRCPEQKTSVEIPESVKAIGSWAFCDCKYISDIISVH